MFILYLRTIEKKLQNNYQKIIMETNLTLKNIMKNITTIKKKNFHYSTYLYNLFQKPTQKTNNLFIKFIHFLILSQLQKQLSYNKIHNYLLKMIFLKSNVLISVTDIKGKIFAKSSSGSMHFKGKQKVKPFAINKVFKKIKFKLIKNLSYSFSIHVKGKYKKKFIFNKLKKFLELKSIVNFNLLPFNGCRQRKRKRKKRKKILFLI